VRQEKHMLLSGKARELAVRNDWFITSIFLLRVRVCSRS